MSERLRLFFFVLFEIEMLMLAGATMYIATTTFGTLKRIENKIDDMTHAMRRK